MVAGAGPPAAGPVDDASLAAEVTAAQQDGTRRNDAIVAVARRHGLSRGDVYDAVLRDRAAGQAQ